LLDSVLFDVLARVDIEDLEHLAKEIKKVLIMRFDEIKKDVGWQLLNQFVDRHGTGSPFPVWSAFPL
jgi:hypothetical protein